MTKYMFFDTETNGLPKNYKAPYTDLDNWSRMIQLAWHACDENGNVISEEEMIIKPEGFTIPQEASDVHGITTEQALEEGRPLIHALNDFLGVMQGIDILVAHNTPFDLAIVASEIERLTAGNGCVVADMPYVCTMREATDYCKIPSPRGYGYKWPRLTQLHEILFDKGFDGAHDALVDVKACKDCFFELQKRGIIEEHKI